MRDRIKERPFVGRYVEKDAKSLKDVPLRDCGWPLFSIVQELLKISEGRDIFSRHRHGFDSLRDRVTLETLCDMMEHIAAWERAGTPHEAMVARYAALAVEGLVRPYLERHVQLHMSPWGLRKERLIASIDGKRVQWA